MRLCVVTAGVWNGGKFLGELRGWEWRRENRTDAIAIERGSVSGLQVPRFLIVAGLAGLVEAFSVQNDNLTLPLYMWAMLVFGDVVE